MIQSMTGFGKATLQKDSKKITVEIKSLNSKGLDLNMRTPMPYRELELNIRNIISQKLERGKIDLILYVDSEAEQSSNKVNAKIVHNYIQQLKNISPYADETELLKMAIRMPDAMKIEKEELDNSEIEVIQNAIQNAIQNLITFRIAEGKTLETELSNRIQNIRQLMLDALSYDNDRIQAIKERLKTAIADLQTNVDENRFEQELIYYLEKLDITEEKVRLTSHLDYFLETLNSNEANGKKLGFITQEMGREINTMGSKANHSQMQKIVVMMKDELEKIKEQILNVL